MLDRTQGLIAFVRTVEAGSFSGAARALGTSPSAISKSVARLEARFGVRLFQRSTRTLTLTQEGAAYFERVAPLLRALDEAGDVMHATATAQGLLRVTAPGDLGRVLMEPLTREFLPRHRGLKLEISLTDRHVDLIREGFDIAVRAGDVADSDLTSRLVARLPMVLAASPAYLTAHGAPKSKEALRDHDHVRYVLAGKPFPLKFADGSVFTPEGVLDADSGVATRIAALNGMGIVQMLRFAIQDDIDAGRLKPVLPKVPLPLVSVYALHAFGRHAPARARLFIDFLAAKLASFS
ncbi:LysR family transcriptional regulator [Variovorax sp. J22R115]|uniref:LysR family transcriptional regulator n=1 Tax=Variovorax sp. J22R115 TaxID=3053509 RepID=UPI002576C335|nr:LysR family transcriptional regulator [Variovorax sp. J22R115]MDM0049880.1 LysR family transcriptional regulator [Variovorax sp. J22R115]